MHPIISKAGTTLARATGSAGLKIKSASPEIMVGVGIVGIVAGTVLACKATLKADEILEEMSTELEKVDTVRSNVPVERYSERDYQKDLTLVYAKGGAKLVRLYGPAIMILAASIASILCGHNILKKRNLALAAAYAEALKGFSQYRDRVKGDLGDDADRKYAYGLEEEVVGTSVTYDEEGKKHKEKIKGYVSNGSGVLSPYARCFDDSCEQWEDNAYYNETFLITQQREANRILAINKALTLNEVYRMLGFPTTDAGMVVGWIFDKNYDPAEHGYKDQVDFGIFSVINGNAINGVEPAFWLDFNVQGTIYGQMPNRFSI